MMWNLGVPGRRFFSSFIDSLPISEALRQSARDLGIHRLTKVQSELFMPVLRGRSLAVLAPTGTGKTFSYLLPMVSRIYSEKLGVCVIVVPTHELCLQVASSLVGLDAGLTVATVYGKHQWVFDKTKPMPQVVIGTGGRIAGLVKKGLLDHRKIRMLVIDELDSLGGTEYKKEIAPLLDRVGESTQVVAVGAVWTEQLRKTLSEFPVLRSIELVDLTRNDLCPTSISHSIVKVNNESEPARISALATLLEGCDKAIVFADSIREASAIALHPLLVSRSKVFHGDLPPKERESVLNQFRLCLVPVLVATDLASRGIDVPDVRLVVSFRPASASAYIHRAGRVGRGPTSKGQSVVMYCTSEKEQVDRIEDATGVKFEIRSIPTYKERQEMAIQALVAEATETKVSAKRMHAIENILRDPEVAAKVTATCLSALLGPLADISAPRRSILSGVAGYTPVMFVDPGKQVIRSRGDLVTILEDKLKTTAGMIACTESGYIVDVPSDVAQNICQEQVGVEIMVVEKLPRIITDEGTKRLRKKFAAPWRVARRPKTKPNNK